MAIQENTLDLAIIELNRCLKSLTKLRYAPKATYQVCTNEFCCLSGSRTLTAMGVCTRCNQEPITVSAPAKGPKHAAALRASMDATRILADLRQGR